MNRKNMFWGLLLIVIGILFLGRNMDWWDFSIFFRGWWTLFLIVPSFISLIKQENIGSSFLIFFLGILLLLACQDVIDWDILWKIFVPVIIIVIGLSIQEIKSDFKVTSIFGGVELDLRDVTLKEDLMIDCFCLFGGVDIRLPENVKLEISGTPIFGGIENKYRNKEDSKVTIYVNHVTIFGGMDLL